MFYFKIQLVHNPYKFTIWSFVGSVSILSLLLQISDVPILQPESTDSPQELFQIVWLIVITMTTVGYGEVYPQTDFGKVIAVVTALWGAFNLTLLVLTLNQIFKLNE